MPTLQVLTLKTPGRLSYRWKVAKIALISKGEEDPELLFTCPLLCVLDTTGKVIEKLIRIRLAEAVRAGGKLSPKQFGF